MPVPAPTRSSPRRLLRDAAYAALRDAILDGTLEPGERLRDGELGAWLGVSRTPLREALARLEEHGLVETAPQRYTRVTPLDRRQAHDAFQVVATLHGLAAELGCARVTDSDLAEMRRANADLRAALDRHDVDAAIAADDAFHDVLVRASANAEIAPALARLMPGLRRVERLRFGSLTGRSSVRQHDEIMRLAAAGDAAATATAVRANWLTLAASIDEAFHRDAEDT